MRGEITRDDSLAIPPQATWGDKPGLAHRERAVLRSMRFWTAWVWLVLGLGWPSLALTILPHLIPYDFIGPSIVFVAFGSVGCLLRFVFRWHRLQGLISPLDHELASDLDREGEWLVEMRIYQNGFETGSDRGILMIDDSSIAFAGHRTWFSISSDDLRLGVFESMKKRIPEPDVVEQDTVVWLKHPSREVAICFVALSAQYFQACVQIRVAISKIATPPEGEVAHSREYPPLSRDPELRLRGVMRSVWFIGALYGLALFLLPWTLNRETSGLALLLVGCTLALAFYGSYCRWRYLSFLKKLDSFESRTPPEPVRVH